MLSALNVGATRTGVRSRVLLVVMLAACLVAGSACGGGGSRSDAWLNGLALANGARVVKVHHPEGVDAVEAIVGFPAPIAAAGVRAALGSPAGYQEVVNDRAHAEVLDPDRGQVKTTEVARVIVPSGQSASGCTIGVWGMEPVGGGPDFSGVSLDVGCGP